MRSKIQDFKAHLAQKITVLQQRLSTYRLYDLGGLAMNGLTSKKGYSVQHDLAYGLQARQRLDLYRGESQSTEAVPLIVFVHGGAWSHGDKRDYAFIGEALIRSGCNVAILNYRLAPEHVFPSYVNDIDRALDFLDQHQQQLAISTHQIALIGHSAGAFNIASLIYPAENHAVKPRANIKVMIGIAGPYHFDYQGDRLSQHAFDPATSYQQVMPYYFVKSNQIQHYLLIADKDEVVQDSNTFDLQEKLQSVGNHCEVIRIPRTGHISIIGSVSSLVRPFFETQKNIFDALDQAFKAN